MGIIDMGVTFSPYAPVMYIYCLLLLASFGPLAECIECPDIFDEIGGCCYFFSSDSDLKSYDEAQLQCQALGSLYNKIVDLVELGTENSCYDDLKVLHKVTEKRGDFWFGADQRDEPDVWRWQHTHNPFSTSNSVWHPEEPNNGFHNDCLAAKFYNSVSDNVTFDRSYFTADKCSSNKH